MRIIQQNSFRNYLSLILLFFPGILFGLLILLYWGHDHLETNNIFPFLPWQFYIIAVFGVIATIGGVLDWRFHRDPLKLQISKKEREAEAKALGLGGAPMFVLM